MKHYTNNEMIHQTVRHFNLPRKVLLRDSKIVKQLMIANDIENDKEKYFQLFLKNKDLLSTQRYWEVLRGVWILCGGLDKIDIFRKLMLSKKKNRYCFSTPEEAKELRELPDTFKVYRACNDENDGGFSWTYDLNYCKYYKESYQKRMIITKEVNKSDVFALINRNREYEILIIN